MVDNRITPEQIAFNFCSKNNINDDTVRNELANLIDDVCQTMSRYTDSVWYDLLKDENGMVIHNGNTIFMMPSTISSIPHKVHSVSGYY